MNLKLEGKIVVVTGGTGSLGTTLVEKLTQQGASCVVPVHQVADRQENPLKDRPNVQLIKGVDLADEQQADNFYEKVESNNGIPWASVHLAGGFGMGKLEQTSLDDFKHQMRINAFTCYNSCRAAVRLFRKASQGGRIVNIASKPALNPRKGGKMSAYTSSKAVVAALTQSLAEELIDEDILINAVAPSIIDTQQNRNAMPQADHSKWVDPEELAEQILYLISPSNRSTNGAVIPVYGKS